MNSKIVLFHSAAAAVFSATGALAEWNFDYQGEAKALYGYSDVSAKHKKQNKNNRAPTDFWLGLSAENNLSSDNILSFFADFEGGTDQYLKDYNQGSWGERIYAKIQTNYGDFSIGQMKNIAYEQAVSAPDFGPLGVNNSDVADFISNPNWLNRKKTKSFRTLNSTYINTDGDAPKVSYVSPEFYNSRIGVSYVPYTYNRSSLVNKHAEYHNKGAIVVSVENSVEFDTFDLKSSAAYANFFENTQEYSVGISFYRKGFTLGASYLHTEQTGKSAFPKKFDVPDFFDAYRNADAAAVGVGYEIGPFSTALTYFYSKAKDRPFKDEIIQFSNQYQWDKHISIYAAAAHVNFEGRKDVVTDSNKGYTFVLGTQINF